MDIKSTNGNPIKTDADSLRNSETRYRRLFESARDGILILDATTRKITDVNPFMTELLGYTREEFLDKELWEIGLLKDEAASISAFEHLQNNKYIRYEDMPLETICGERREVEFISSVYTENDRQVIQCNIRDITEHKKNENLLLKAEEKYRHLIESSPGIVYLREPNPPYSTVYVSPNINEFGYVPAEFHVTPDMWLSLVESNDRERVRSTSESAMSQDLETNLTYQIKAKDGSLHWWQDKGRFVYDEQERKTGWQGIILDITAAKTLEHQLRQSQKLEAVGLLAGGIAHDFNNMLTAINGYSDLILRQLKEDDPIRENIEEIWKAGQRSAELTAQILAFSRQQVLRPVVLDLNIIISDTTKMLQRVIGEDILLTTTLNPKIGRVKVDPSQFTQIIMNLAVNAREAMPEGGKLTIETANCFLNEAYAERHFEVPAGDYVMVAFSDTGIGMSPETKEKIFEPFFTTKAVGISTGLGLSTVYGIVKQSGGSIEVYSEEKIGSTFKVYIPRIVEQVRTIGKIQAKLPELLTGTETILLVEDEEIVRKLSIVILEECGYTVVAASNGSEAIRIFESGDYHFDLLITDIVMPLMGGRELVEILAAKSPDLRILYTSGYTDDAVVRHGVIESNHNFIQKPFSLDSLSTKIREILDNPPG